MNLKDLYEQARSNGMSAVDLEDLEVKICHIKDIDRVGNGTSNMYDVMQFSIDVDEIILTTCEEFRENANNK
jgi:hypothetical protein